MQDKNDSQGQITRNEIVSLLQQGNVGLARAKAQNLIHEDSVGDLLEALEMHVGLIIEHFGEIEQKYVRQHVIPSFIDPEQHSHYLFSNASMSSVVEEAACSIVYAAPHTESKGMPDSGPIYKSYN